MSIVQSHRLSLWSFRDVPALLDTSYITLHNVYLRGWASAPWSWCQRVSADNIKDPVLPKNGTMLLCVCRFHSCGRPNCPGFQRMSAWNKAVSQQNKETRGITSLMRCSGFYLYIMDLLCASYHAMSLAV